MSTTLELINAIAEGDASATEDAFQAAMAEKIGAKLDDMRTNVAKSMFNAVVEESVELDEAMDDGHKAAKQVAKAIAASHKNLRVTSDGNTHYVHHKDDEDGNDTLQVHHEGGKIHLTHETGVAGYHHETHDTPESAIASGTKIANGQ